MTSMQTDSQLPRQSIWETARQTNKQTEGWTDNAGSDQFILADWYKHGNSLASLILPPRKIGVQKSTSKLMHPYVTNSFVWFHWVIIMCVYKNTCWYPKCQSLSLSLSLYICITRGERLGRWKPLHATQPTRPNPSPLRHTLRLHWPQPHPDSIINAPPRACTDARQWRAEIHASLLTACTNACKPGVQKFTPPWR